MDWFERLVGFQERSPEQVRRLLTVEDEHIISTVNNRRFRCGRLDIPSLAQLRAQTAHHSAGPIRVREVLGDAKELHMRPEANGATFQVASQFNLLEMVHPSVTPEMGVARYENDPTQGPACAVACGAGTIYRNYFVPVDGAIGQTEGLQIDTAREFGEAVGNADGSVWQMRNGYALGYEEGLVKAGQLVAGLDEAGRDRLREKIRIGVQYSTQVTAGGSNVVTQAYCSGFPVGYEYNGFGSSVWEGVARVLLEGVYECTLRAAVANWQSGGSNIVFLTQVGGGVFGNDQGWILDGMERAFTVMQDSGLDVRIVSYRRSSSAVKGLSR